MVNFCAVIGCSNDGYKKNISFFRLPSIIKHHNDEKTEELSSRRQDMWLAAIDRADIKMEKLYVYRVCSQHFLSGKSGTLL